MFNFAVFDWKRPFWCWYLLFLFWTEITFLEKPVLSCQSCYKFFKLFHLIMSGFCFGKLVTTPENVLALRSFLFLYMKQFFLYFIKHKLICFDWSNFDWTYRNKYSRVFFRKVAFKISEIFQSRRLNNFTILMNWTGHNGLNKLTY